jgi:hypothetical protein
VFDSLADFTEAEQVNHTLLLHCVILGNTRTLLSHCCYTIWRTSRKQSRCRTHCCYTVLYSGTHAHCCHTVVIPSGGLHGSRAGAAHTVATLCYTREHTHTAVTLLLHHLADFTEAEQVPHTQTHTGGTLLSYHCCQNRCHTRTLASHCCYTIVVTLLSRCCHTVVTLLLHCCHTVVTLFLHCCYTFLTLLSQCCYTLVTLLSHCCYTVVTLLSHCCYTLVTLLLVII